ncbi:MAG TPA: hypothetical protein VGS58_06670, partial [Candidatus Sulfopaludibacter sp.]|nr:hypothetical protein [Candidatus Sulfopaludibacter sp.]
RIHPGVFCRTMEPDQQPAPRAGPAGLRFAFTSAAAGDPFSGKLTGALRDSRRRLPAPKGAVLEGRLIHVERFWSPPRVLVARRPDHGLVNGAGVPPAAARDWRRKVAERRNRPERNRDSPAASAGR